MLNATLYVVLALASVSAPAQEPHQESPAPPSPAAALGAEERKAALRGKALLQRLASDDTEVRKAVSSDLFGAGENLDAVLDEIAVLVGQQMPRLTAKDDLADEVAWHLKALGASGKAKYRPLIEQGLGSQNKHVASHALTAMRALELTSKTGFPLLVRSKVRRINALEAQECVLVRPEHYCSSMRGVDRCQYDIGREAMEAGGDAYLPVAAGRSRMLVGVGARVIADLYLCRGDYTKDDGSF